MEIEENIKQYQQDIKDMRYVLFGIPLYLFLNVLDIMSTYKLINIGYNELNPIMVNFVHSIHLMIITKLIGIFIICIFGYLVYKYYPKYRPLKNIPIIACSILGIVVINNLYLLWGV